MLLSKEKIKASLTSRTRIDIQADKNYRPAAVLIPLYLAQLDAYLILTKRTESVEHHKGQISFPGGLYDQTDGDFLITALREAYEELGIQRQDIEVVGALDDMLTITGFLVRPFVGFIPYPYLLQPNKDEVQEVLHIPLTFFLEPTNLREEVLERDGIPTVIYSYSYNDHRIWGATARIINHFVELLTGVP